MLCAAVVGSSNCAGVRRCTRKVAGSRSLLLLTREEDNITINFSGGMEEDDRRIYIPRERYGGAEWWRNFLHPNIHLTSLQKNPSSLVFTGGGKRIPVDHAPVECGGSSRLLLVGDVGDEARRGSGRLLAMTTSGDGGSGCDDDR
nr:hypothetical protein Iba_chr04eCG19680 [Ipomoea batatas]